MKKSTESPITVQTHDKFFRAAMANPRVARDFFISHLPTDILQAVNLENLELQPGSYIDDIGNESIADILYKVSFADQEAYLYLLVEHQCRPDELMPFRVLKYSCNLINQHLKITKNKKIPLIYPFVIYHGEHSYPYSTDIKDIVDAPEQLIQRYFLKPFQLIDLGKIEDEELKKHAWAGVMEFALKHVFSRDIILHLQDIIDLLHAIERAGGSDYITSMLQYWFIRGEVKDKPSFFKLINEKISRDIGEKTMSLAEQYYEEGVEKGLEKGLEKGKLESRIEIARRLLSAGVDTNFIAKITQLSVAEVQQL